MALLSTSRLKYYYKNYVLSDLVKQNFFQNIHELPEIEALQIHMGLKEGAIDEAKMAPGLFILTQLSNQKAHTTQSKQSIANFKLREGLPIGACVTLRGDQVFDFLDKFLFQILPIEKDLASFDRFIVYNERAFTIGYSDSFSFPELESEYEKLHPLAQQRRSNVDAYGFAFTILLKEKCKLKSSFTSKEQIQVFLSSLLIPLKVNS